MKKVSILSEASFPASSLRAAILIFKNALDPPLTLLCHGSPLPHTMSFYSSRVSKNNLNLPGTWGPKLWLFSKCGSTPLLALGSKGGNWERDAPPVVSEDQVCDCQRNTNIHWPMGPSETQLKMWQHSDYAKVAILHPGRLLWKSGFCHFVGWTNCIPLVCSK